MESSELDLKKSNRSRKNIDQCAEELLKLVARGSAIICEILRLKDYIPEPFYNKNEEKNYKDIIFDYSLLKQGGVLMAKLDDKIKQDQELADKDEDFRLNHIDIISRFFSLFQSIFQYIEDWKAFVNQVNSNIFVQHTINTILSNKNMRPLFCESVFNAGIMLILTDRLIPGIIREKLIMSYYRYKGGATIPNFNEIYELFERTGYIPSLPITDVKEEVRPKRYPVDFFKRCKLDTKIIEQINLTIVGNDIYDQQLVYPTTNEYKNVTFSQQASLIAVNLFFTPDTLDKDKKNILDIMNKHFQDNLVVSLYMGYTIDLNDYWKDFKAANQSLDYNKKNNIIKDTINENIKKIKELDDQIKKYLNEGVMTEESVLNQIEDLLNLMRISNVVLRFFLLQRNTTRKSARELINEKLNNKDLINLLLDLSQFEYLVKTMFQNLVFNKDTMWDNDKGTCIQKLSELISYYSGNSAFNSTKLEEYSKYFEDLSNKVNKLDTKNPTKVGNRISKLKKMIEGVTKLTYISESANAKENLAIVNKKLDHMLLLINVKKNYLISISKISDFSYAWIYIHDYKKELQDLLKQDSKNVLLLRATFLKLASILNTPLGRLFEIDSPDIESVSEYYSGELVKYVKDILQVIPHRVFELMNIIYTIFCNNFKEMPNKILRKELKDYSQIKERFELAKAAHGISMITKGILMMEKTLMGVIEVDPKVILEEGIRTELLKVLGLAFQKHIDFGPMDKIDLKKKLNTLFIDLSALKKSFIYIQDYINLNGSKIWSEEMHRLINFYVELEANKFLSKKIKNVNDKYENLKYQIPSYPPLKTSPESYTFLGRITRYILNLTDPKNSTFCLYNSTWYEKEKLDKEVFGIKLLQKIKSAMGIEAFQGLGRMLGYFNCQNLAKLQPFFNSKIFNENLNSLSNINKQFGSPFVCNEINPNLENDLLDKIRNYSSKITDPLMEIILKIGQIEYMRKLQNYILSENSVIDCSTLNTELKALDIINLIIVKNDIKLNFESNEANQNALNTNPEKKGNPELDLYYNNLLTFLDDFGFIDTDHTFFQNLNSLQYLPAILAITSFTYLKKNYDYDKPKMTITKRIKENFDMSYYTLGMYCILYQMGKKNVVTYISMISEILRYKLIKQTKQKPDMKNIKKEVNSNASGENNPQITKHIPLLLFDLHELADNCDISLDYFDINLNNYLMFKNICTYTKIEPPKKKK